MTELETAEITASLRRAMPIAMETLALGDAPVGLVIVDEVNGFASVGHGNMAPPQENPQVTRMVEETNRLARAFTESDWPILALLDSHEPGKPEPPYPPHCEIGSGEENLVPALSWLENDANVTLVRKDCINGFVGAIADDGTNRVVEWANRHGLARLLVVGICTDICVMDFVLTMLSARNHSLMPTVEDIMVFESGCATYDLPLDVARSAGLGDTAAHPQDVTHYMGLYFMASRGARLIDAVSCNGGAA